jgi:hypothetical protein
VGLFEAAKLLPSFALELQAEFNQEFFEDLRQIELERLETYGKHGNAGKNICAILTGSGFRLKNAKSSLPNNARRLTQY